LFGRTDLRIFRLSLKSLCRPILFCSDFPLSSRSFLRASPDPCRHEVSPIPWDIFAFVLLPSGPPLKIDMSSFLLSSVFFRSLPFYVDKNLVSVPTYAPLPISPPLGSPFMTSFVILQGSFFRTSFATSDNRALPMPYIPRSFFLLKNEVST